jgi:hypothetical protein
MNKPVASAIVRPIPMYLDAAAACPRLSTSLLDHVISRAGRATADES